MLKFIVVVRIAEQGGDPSLERNDVVEVNPEAQHMRKP